ncbi:hypothetical protein ABKA04_008111 [Annulohypoxylon sp. FPYF3050]
MEPPTKRMKLGQAPYDDNDEDEINLDELSMDPIQFDARQDPLYELDKGRAKAASRLKSAFERIFEKYERDFTDIGDEIDLETGEVIVNNGHLLSLQDEKDRNREGSISSDEEERIMRGKEASSVEASRPKPPVQNTSFTQPQLGYSVPPNQQLMTHPQFSSPGMPPNQYGFIDPFMGHGPADPLWQAPDLPMPLYQDRFGFIGQPMAYPPSFGYGYGPMMAPGGGFGQGSFGNHFRPQVPKKLPPTKAPARQLLPRASSDVDESEEDDVLLGGNTEEVIKSVSIKSVKALPSNTVAGKTKQALPKNTKSIPVVEKEKDTQKPRRGRPKKTSVPAKPPDSNEGTNEKCGGNAEIIPTTEMINPTKSMNNSLPVPTLPSPPPSEEPIPTEKVTTELTKTDASTEVPIVASSDTPTEGDSQSSGSQRRRSSRGRKQTEFYGQINWTKSRKPNLDVTDSQTTTTTTTTTTEDLTQPSIPLVSEVNSSAEQPRPEDSLGKETMEPDLGTQSEKVNDKDISNETDVTVTSVPDEEHHAESLVNTDNPEESEMPQSVPINLHPTVENSEHSGPLSLIGESDTAKIEILHEDKGISSPNESRKSNNLSDGERVLPTHLPDRTAQHTTPQESDIQEANVEVSGAEITSGAGEKVTLPSVTEPDISVAVDENPESNSISDNPQEKAQSPTIQIQLEEAAAQLPSPVQEEDLLPEAEIEIPESEIDEPESTELEMPVKDTPSQPSLTEDSDPISLPDEDEPELPPARLPIPHQSRIPGLFEKAELAFRPQVVQKDPRAKIVQRKSTSPSKSPSPSKHRPSPSAKPSTTPVPSTPKKKRRDSRTESGHTTASARKKYALTSLIPDDPDEDDDELSVLASSVAPSPFLSSYTHSSAKPYSRFNPLSAATPRKTSRRTGFPTGASTSTTSRSALRTPHRISKRGAPPATDTRASRGPKLRYGSGSGSGVQSSPLARTVMSLNHRELLAATPSRRGRNKDRDEVGSVELGNSPVRTPGGTARRCGEDGFTCDRDFCFTCCK